MGWFDFAAEAVPSCEQQNGTVYVIWRYVHSLTGTLSTALSAVTLAAYVHTLCPGTPGGDAGELLQVALELGIAHPPGYPLWTMMAHGFSRLPLRNTTAAWRVNLSSAVYGALAAGTLSLGVGSWSGSPWAGVAAGGAFAFSPLVWEYSVQCEVSYEITRDRPR